MRKSASRRRRAPLAVATKRAAPRPGENLQRLVTLIERATHHAQNVRVESPKRVPDKDTGRRREHDVVLTFMHRHHTLVLALECRDRTRKVGVPDVEAFHQKCKRTGIDRGIMVSSTGFAKTALTKAESFSIGCLSLDEAAGFDWCLAPGVEIKERRLLHTHVQFQTERLVGAGSAPYNANGKLLSNEDLAGFGLQCLQKIPRDADEAVGQPIRHRCVDSSPQFYVVDKTGDRIAAKAVVIDVEYEVVKERLVPFEFRQYVDMAKGQKVLSAAVASIEHEEIPVSIVLLQEEGQDAKIMIVPGKR